MGQPKILPRWYSVLFFAIAIILFIAAVVLFNNWNSHVSRCALNYVAQVSESYTGYDDCLSQKNGIWYGAVICLAIGAVFKLIAWICVITHCIQLRRANQLHYAVTYQTVPPMELNQQPYGAYGHYAPPPGNQYSTGYPPGYPPHYPAGAPGHVPAPMYPGTAYHGPDDVKSPTTNNTHAPAHYA